MVRVAINGFGRIGRLVLKICLERKIPVVAINDLVDTKTLAYLLTYDSVHTTPKETITYGEGFIKIGSKKIPVFAEKDPAKLPWKKLRVDAVVESTGFFTDGNLAKAHISAGAKRVLITAPAKNQDVTIVPGVNHAELKKGHQIISVASCTTNALSPVVKVLEDSFGVEQGFMNTVHAYTSTQSLIDGPKKKLRRGRAAAINMIPTTSGATTATCEVIPTTKGKLDGLALRVPLPSGSIVDFTGILKKRVTREDVNAALKKASEGKMKGILGYTEDEIVSSDIVGDSHSSIVDGLSTMALGKLVKVLAWYDNEYGYSCRVVDVIKMLK